MIEGLFDPEGNAQLARLNSMTKYPSILTYHQLGQRGRLDDTIQVRFDDDDDVIVTEKIDGTNTRIILLPDNDNDYFIASREELLYAKDDRLWIPSQGIVAASYNFATQCDDLIRESYPQHEFYCVVFGESFGGKITAGSKNYTGKGATSFRVFDMVLIERSLADEIVLGWDRARIASWRDKGGQPFLGEYDMTPAVASAGLNLTPRLATIKGKDLPKDHKDVLEWLGQISPKTKVRLDDGAKAKSEGVVIRTPCRGKIAKIRYEDYERTLRPSRSGKKKV